MCLHAVGEVVEGAGVGEITFEARQIRNLVRDGVPDAVVLVGGCMFRGRDLVALCNQGVHIDHCLMVLQEADGGFAGGVVGEGTDACPGGPFGERTHDGWMSMGEDKVNASASSLASPPCEFMLDDDVRLCQLRI